MSSQLEQTILGAALNHDHSAQLATAKLQPTDFYEPRNELIFNAIAKAVVEDTPVSPVSIAQAVDHNRTGGAPYLFELVQSACLPAHLEHHIHTLKQDASRRRMRDAGEHITQLADQDNFDHALNQAQELLDGVVGVDSSEAHLIADSVDDTVEKIVQYQEGTAPEGVKSGFYDLDRLTNGFMPGQMVIVAARPGVGKSTLAVDIMRHLSIHNNVPTAIFSLEMSTDEITNRVLASEARVNIGKFRRRGALTREEFEDITAARNSLEGAPFYIDDSPENTVQEIVAKTKSLVKRKGVQLVVVDYLQLLKSSNREESRQQEVANFSRTLKLLAKSAGIPVIAVAQLNRESERNNTRPKPSDLRESGALEQDADVVLLLHRDDVASRDEGQAGEVDVIVGKNRGGETGVATLGNELHYGCFSNFAKDRFTTI